MACSIPDCGRSVRAGGLCSRHYRALRVNGDPLLLLRVRSDSMDERLATKVNRNGLNGCWEWLGGTNGRYGTISVGGREKAYAHRVLYEIHVGPIPDGLELDHLCKNTLCVNPAHLEPVTQRENNLRSNSRSARQARQTECIHGHPFDEQNTYIRRNGQRMCRRCLYIRSAERRGRRRAARA